MKSHSILLLIIILVGFFAGISSDIYIPSLPSIADDLQTPMEKVQRTLAIFMLGLSISQLFYGPISEGIGRRIPLIVGFVIVAIGSLICFLAANIEGLLLGRFIQGVGAGAGASLWRSIFRDSFEGPLLAKYGGYLSVIVAFIVPAAPTVGGYLETYFGWRSNFIVLTIYAVLTIVVLLMLFQETSHHHHPERLKRTFIMKASRELLTSRIFMGYAACTLVTYGAFFAWLTSSPVLFMTLVGLTPVQFGWITFIGGGGTMMCAGYLNGRMVMKYGTHFMLRLGWGILFLAGISMLGLKFLYGINTTIIVVPMLLFYFGTTFIWPSVFAGAFAPFGKIAGYAGSFYSFMQLAGGAAVSALVSYLPETSQVSIASIFVVAAILSLSIFEYVVVSAESQKS